MTINATLSSLGRTYTLPTKGNLDWQALTRYLLDLSTVVNSIESGTLVTPVFNVKNYGALGNGVADDTVAILAAMAALALTTTVGGSLYFPAGTYKHTQRLLFTSSQRNTRVTGDGVSSVLKPTGAFSTNACVEFQCDFWSVDNVKIDASARTGTGDNILATNASYGHVSDAVLANSTSYGIRYAGTSKLNTFDPSVQFTANAAGPWRGANSTLPEYRVDVAREFGVIADGATDTTAAVQAALTWGFNRIEDQQQVVLVFPAGDMIISSTLLVKGNSSTSPALAGATPGRAFGSIASTFKWNGADNGTLMYFEAFNKGIVENLVFNGASKAGILTHLAATKFSDQTVLAASDGYRFRDCVFKHVKPNVSGNGCVAVGTDPALVSGNTLQSSDGAWDNCSFIGENPGTPGFDYATMEAYGWKTLSGGNCKNFELHDVEFITCGTAVDWNAGSGYLLIENIQGADVRTGIRHSSGPLIVHSGDFECGHVSDFVFLRGSGGGGDTRAEIHGIEAFGTCGPDALMIGWAGSLTLKNCAFANSDADTGEYIPFEIHVPAEEVPGVGVGTSINSEGHIFFGCGTDFPPFFNSTGRIVPEPDTYGGLNSFRVRSFSDRGTEEGDTTPVAYPTFDSSFTRLFGTRYGGPIQLSYLRSGNPGSAGSGDTTVLSINATSAPQTVTLAAPTADLRGRWVRVIKRDATANTVTVGGVVLSKQGEAVEFICGADLSNDPAWEVLSRAADATHPGYVTTGTQSFAGTKTFTGAISASNLSNTNSGDVTLAAVGSSPNANGVSLSGQVVNLQPADGSNPGALTAAAQVIGGPKTFAAPSTYSGTSGIAAFAGGGQGSAVALTTEVNVVGTVASAADSVKLPAAALGKRYVVVNNGANSVAVFPASGGSIDALGADTAYSLTNGGASREFWGISATAWISR